jgi:hypothetical protein
MTPSASFAIFFIFPFLARFACPIDTYIRPRARQAPLHDKEERPPAEDGLSFPV